MRTARGEERGKAGQLSPSAGCWEIRLVPQEQQVAQYPGTGGSVQTLIVEEHQTVIGF